MPCDCKRFFLPEIVRSVESVIGPRRQIECAVCRGGSPGFLRVCGTKDALMASGIYAEFHTPRQRTNR